jgi:hypothetical protein
MQLLIKDGIIEDVMFSPVQAVLFHRPPRRFSRSSSSEKLPRKQRQIGKDELLALLGVDLSP